MGDCHPGADSQLTDVEINTHQAASVSGGLVAWWTHVLILTSLLPMGCNHLTPCSPSLRDLGYKMRTNPGVVSVADGGGNVYV